MLLSVPTSFGFRYIAGFFLCGLVGAICSRSQIWYSIFPKKEGSYEIYRKRGEYGEYEKRLGMVKSSPFQEPLNAWTSLIYSVFGIVIFITGYVDLQTDLDDVDPAKVYNKEVSVVHNRMTDYGGFSICYGLSCIYLGLSSFLFHASHAEYWRKADAGMTSGVLISLVAFSLWDRLRPAGLEFWGMFIIIVLLVFSMIFGFVPYGSSDILLPVMVAVTWGVEMIPRYGGVVDPGQYLMWAECVYATIIGFLMRTIDVKRNNQKLTSILYIVATLLTIYPFGYFIGYTSFAILCGVGAISIVYMDISLGHIFWHFGSGYALYIWWEMFRLRPGDPLSTGEEHSDNFIATIILFVLVKNGVRRIFMTLECFPNDAYKERVFFLIEHTVFAVWAYYVLVYVPSTVDHSFLHKHHENRYKRSQEKLETMTYGSIPEGIDFKNNPTAPSVASWLIHPVLCWYGETFPFDSFKLFYLAKVGTHLEDVLFMMYKRFGKKPDDLSSTPTNSSTNQDHNDDAKSPKTDKLPLLSTSSTNPGADSNKGGKGTRVGTDQLDTNVSITIPASMVTASDCTRDTTTHPVHNKNNRDMKMEIHHISTAILCITSAAIGHAKVGSLIMFLHDVSDIPLDLVRIFGLGQGKVYKYAQMGCMAITLLTWLYWRLYWFPVYVLYSIAFESRSLIKNSNCFVGKCTFIDVPERVPFLLLLGSLLVLHVIWYIMMVKKSWAAINETKKESAA
jgi:hypothetical protein